jgi:chloramphenicol-sensitive protein RarD
MGLLAVIAAYVLWALVPVYWKFLQGIPALELLMHRVVWSFLLLLPFLYYRQRWPQFVSAFRQRRLFALQSFAACLLAINWLTYVWAVTNDRIVEASLGYFLCPLASIAFGFLFEKERLRRLQWLAVTFAACGVLFKIASQGYLPLVSLSIAFSWSGYSLMKKRTSLSSVSGLAVESAILLPIGSAYLIWLQAAGKAHFLNSGVTNDILLIAAGVVTTIPLLLFAAGAKQVKLSTIGILQYTVPTGTLLLGVLVYGEPFLWSDAVSFALIWLGILLYVGDHFCPRPITH